MSDYSENDDEPQLYGDMRNYALSNGGAFQDIKDFLTLVCAGALIAAVIFCLIWFVFKDWYLFVNQFFFGAVIPADSALEGDMTVFAFITTVVALFGITTAICYTVYRVKKLEIESNYRHKSLEQDHAFQMKYLEAQSQAQSSPPASEN